MKGIKNIIFDLGGVIINLDNQRTEDAFTSLGVKDFRSYFGHGHASSFFKEYEVGRLSDQQFVDSIRQLTGLAVPDEAIVDSWNALLLDFPPERIQLLKQLRKTYRLFLFLPFQQYQCPSFGSPATDLHRDLWWGLPRRSFRKDLLLPFNGYAKA